MGSDDGQACAKPLTSRQICVTFLAGKLPTTITKQHQTPNNNDDDDDADLPSNNNS
jgi:hypothetical protein